jgi:hypothetical protein
MNEEEIRKQAERSVVEIHEFTPDMEPFGWKVKDKAKKKPKKNRPIKSFRGIKVPSCGWHAKTAILKLSSGSFAGMDYCICTDKGSVIGYFYSEQKAQNWWVAYCQKREYEITVLKVPKVKYAKRTVHATNKDKPVNPFAEDTSKDHTKNSNHCIRSGCQRFRVPPHDFCDIHL